MNEDYIYKVGDFYIQGLKYYFYIKLNNLELDYEIAEKMGMQLLEYIENFKKIQRTL